MLILSRKHNEKLLIGDNIVLTVVAIFPDKVRIGIEAPESVAIHRLEVFNAIQRNDGVRRPANKRRRSASQHKSGTHCPGPLQKFVNPRNESPSPPDSSPPDSSPPDSSVPLSPPSTMPTTPSDCS